MAKEIRRGMARCEYPGCWQIGIWQVEKGGGCGRWRATATGPGTIGDGHGGFFDSLSEAYQRLTGEPMPGADSRGMVPQPVQQQQASAGKGRPPRPVRPIYKWDVTMILGGRERVETVNGYNLGNARYMARQRFPGCAIIGLAQHPPADDAANG